MRALQGLSLSLSIFFCFLSLSLSLIPPPVALSIWASARLTSPLFSGSDAAETRDVDLFFLSFFLGVFLEPALKSPKLALKWAKPST